MAPEIIIDKDGNKRMGRKGEVRKCNIYMDSLDFGKIESHYDIIPGSDFTRCDYSSFSKWISNYWILKTILSSRSK